MLPHVLLIPACFPRFLPLPISPALSLSRSPFRLLLNRFEGTGWGLDLDEGGAALAAAMARRVDGARVACVFETAGGASAGPAVLVRDRIAVLGGDVDG